MVRLGPGLLALRRLPALVLVWSLNSAARIAQPSRRRMVALRKSRSIFAAAKVTCVSTFVRGPCNTALALAARRQNAAPSQGPQRAVLDRRGLYVAQRDPHLRPGRPSRAPCARPVGQDLCRFAGMVAARPQRARRAAAAAADRALGTTWGAWNDLGVSSAGHLARRPTRR